MMKRVKECPVYVGEKWCDGYLITFPVSYRYNGGISVNNRHYEGFTVKNPKIPKGFETKSICCGLQLNAKPPLATRMILRKDGKKFTKNELEALLTH
jgi:hypothetical protein